MSDPTPRHWALAAEAVTTGPMTERDIVTRVAHLLANTEGVGTSTIPERATLIERLTERFTGQPISFEFNLGPAAAINLAHLAADEILAVAAV